MLTHVVVRAADGCRRAKTHTLNTSLKKSRHEINQPFVSSNCESRNGRAVRADHPSDVSNINTNQADELRGVVAHAVLLFNCVAALHGTGVALVGRGGDGDADESSKSDSEE